MHLIPAASIYHSLFIKPGFILSSNVTSELMSRKCQTANFVKKIPLFSFTVLNCATKISHFFVALVDLVFRISVK